jgi:hypothetical protein
MDYPRKKTTSPQQLVWQREQPCRTDKVKVGLRFLLRPLGHLSETIDYLQLDALVKDFCGRQHLLTKQYDYG